MSILLCPACGAAMYQARLLKGYDTTDYDPERLTCALHGPLGQFRHIAPDRPLTPPGQPTSSMRARIPQASKRLVTYHDDMRESRKRRICRNCGCLYVFALSHPTLTSVCPFCLAPTGGDASGPRRRTTMSSKDRRRRMAKVVERDGWACHLCGEAIDPDATGGDRPTLDHVIPRSQGGADRARNLRLAHARCNNARGDAPLPKQAREQT